MERILDEELRILKDKILYMGNLAEMMIDLSIKILLERNRGLIEQIYQHEGEINKLNIEIDNQCLKILALWQPEASDLRFILAIIKINSELERLGDQAINIAQNSLELLKHNMTELIEKFQFREVTELARKMVKDSIDSFINRDIKLAREVLIKDSELDNFKKQIFQRVISITTETPSSINQGLDLILIARNLEKIGDHATNICEDIIFMVEGKDVRHHADEKK